MLNVRNLYITNVPQDTANAYRLVMNVLSDDYNYDYKEDESEDILVFLMSERNYLCDDYRCKDISMYNWINFTKPSRKHIVMTYGEFVKKYLGLTEDQLTSQMLNQFEIKLMNDKEYCRLSNLAKGDKVMNTLLLSRYTKLASNHFNTHLTEEQCRLIQIAQSIIK